MEKELLTHKNIVIENIINDYINSLDVTKTSKEVYKRALKQFINYIKDKHTLTRLDILDYKNYLLNNYSAYTVSNYLSVVKGLFRYLESEKISTNIAIGIKGAKLKEGFNKDCLTVEQVKNTLNSIDVSTLEGKRNYALINLLVRTGLRLIEVERANVGDIRQQGGEALFWIQGKGRDHKDEVSLLTESTLRPIRIYLKERGNVKDNEPFLISVSDRNYSKRLTTRSISRIIKQALINAGIDSSRLTAHSLRHTSITLALLGGATIQETQRMARHSNVNTTLIYAHNINRIKQAPERKIDKILNGGLEIEDIDSIK